jgi:hypothetical protein
MLDFPASPTTGEVFSSGGLQWVWDGVKWNGVSNLPMPIADGGTGQTTAAAALSALGGFPEVGVTDGSNAAAGQVGEFLSNTASGVPLTSSAALTVVSLTLSPGDWDVWGLVELDPSAPAQALVAGFSTVTNQLGAYTICINTTEALFYNPFNQAPPVNRYNVTVATTVYLVVQCNFTGASCSADGQMYARRMR